MTKNRKQVVRNGQTYERLKGSSGRYANVNNPNDSISRRQAEKSELAKSGFTSFEQKAQARKAANIPKGFRYHEYKAYTKRIFYRKRVHSIAELEEHLALIDDDKYITIVKAFGVFTTESGKSLLKKRHAKFAWFPFKAGYATSEYYLSENVDFYGQKTDFLERGILLKGYEINITPKQN